MDDKIKPNNPGIYSTSEPEKSKPKAKNLQIRVISKNNSTALINWEENGIAHCGYIPKDEISDGMVSKDILEIATPYGISWDDFPELPVLKKEMLINHLHKLGIWSTGDIRSRVADVQFAIAEVTGIALVKILEYANSKEV